MASVTELTENDLLNALREAFGSQGETQRWGMTTKELKKALGIGQQRIRDTLRELIDRGEVACHLTYMPSISGARMGVPEYYLVKKD